MRTNFILRCISFPVVLVFATVLLEHGDSWLAGVLLFLAGMTLTTIILDAQEGGL